MVAELEPGGIEYLSAGHRGAGCDIEITALLPGYPLPGRIDQSYAHRQLLQREVVDIGDLEVRGLRRASCRRFIVEGQQTFESDGAANQAKSAARAGDSLLIANHVELDHVIAGHRQCGIPAQIEVSQVTRQHRAKLELLLGDDNRIGIDDAQIGYRAIEQRVSGGVRQGRGDQYITIARVAVPIAEHITAETSAFADLEACDLLGDQTVIIGIEIRMHSVAAGKDRAGIPAVLPLITRAISKFDGLLIDDTIDAKTGTILDQHFDVPAKGPARVG